MTALHVHGLRGTLLGALLLGGLLAAGGCAAESKPSPAPVVHEDWPVYHVTALPEEGVALPYDANGCIFWKGRYHLMYIFQDPGLPDGGHCWGHLSSTDLINWTYHPPTLIPAPGDPDKGIFSGNAFINKDGVPMLCWFGIDAGVCVATAEDDGLILWKKHPKNPIIPMPKKGDPGFGVYTVWDPYLWLDGDTYYCLLGGNSLPNKKDTLYLCKSPDLVTWQPLHPFYEHPDLSWTVETTNDADMPEFFRREDCSCPDFFKLGDKHVLMCISHKVGARCYIGRYENEKFFPEQHVRMNWPGAQFFAPESLLDDKGRRVIWAWVTDPRVRPSQDRTGSGFQSLPRIIALNPEGGLTITPAPELEVLRANPRRTENLSVKADADTVLDGAQGDCLELAVEIDPGDAKAVGMKVRCTPDGKEETAIWYDPAKQTLSIDVSKSTLRDDLAYDELVFTGYNSKKASDNKTPVYVAEAPLALKPGEPLKLRVFLDKAMLEVFANDRQCVTQVIYPKGPDATGIKFCAKGGSATVRAAEAWDMTPLKFVNEKHKP
jgi:sucrose-6-phosphate hydrolase SacC (GH32 family)